MRVFLGLLGVVGIPALALWGAAALFGPLAVFAALVPLDGGVEEAGQGIAYGSEPRQKLDLYRPAGGGQDLPVVVFVYGGAWKTGDRRAYQFAGRALASRGILTAVIDYRLVPEVRFPAFVEDTAAAVGWVHRNAAAYGGDPSRIIVVGHSAGAYNAAMAALDSRYLAAQGIDPRVVAGAAALAGPFDFLPLDDPDTIAAFSGWPKPLETQPVARVTPDAPPFLMLTGDSDSTVGPYNSRNLKAKLDAAGVESRIVLYPGLDHAGLLTALSRPLRWRAPVLDDLADFIHSRKARTGATPQASAKSS
jgi:acetyl esterase/lipase